MWSRVDLPTPEAPMTATVSPTLTVRLAPFSTRTGSGPIRYSRSRSVATSSGSLIAQDLYRVESGGPPSGRQRCEERNHKGGADHQGEVGSCELHGQIADLVDVAGEADDPIGVLHPDQEQAQGAAPSRPHHADHHAGHEEDPPDAARARPHRLEDPDLFP